ncbi:MAG: hypothetical protein LH472_16100 [Pyrinomonadaceae bacterium]|nr:hypothetical protein [Pyrinomonadaceae bacterium]
MPDDGGNLIFTDTEKVEFLQLEPKATSFIKQFVGAEEFINNTSRWCLWLKDVSPTAIRSLPRVLERINNVRNHRLKSNRAATQKLAAFPSLFGEFVSLKILFC